MHYDESKIKKEYITINGQKIPIFKIPTGMSGPNASKINDSDFIEPVERDDAEYSTDSPKHKLYDEDNVYIDNTDKFIDF